jgi:hypothetical protein
MGPTGCIASPHLRPLCTYHTCGINSLGTSGNQKWDQKYFDLRERMTNLCGRKKMDVDVPETCDLCQKPITEIFFDAKTTSGPWANVCKECLTKHCRGIGLGTGQKFEKIGDKWVKTEG